MTESEERVLPRAGGMGRDSEKTNRRQEQWHSKKTPFGVLLRGSRATELELLRPASHGSNTPRVRPWQGSRGGTTAGGRALSPRSARALAETFWGAGTVSGRVRGHKGS